ncbi:MAG: LysE family translocator [Thermoprotei archaeon]|nr:MAG: LysE family translocator [Thermoprotei archaeon]
MGGLVSLVLLTLYISPNGALSPGPLTLSAMLAGVKKGWKGGFYVAVGHVIVELPYVIMLLFIYSAIYTYLMSTYVRMFMALVISSFIFFFAYLTLKSALRAEAPRSLPSKLTNLNPILVGILLTGLNPYFLIWWVTAAAPILLRVNELGLHTFPIMFLTHVWYDFFWLTFIAYLFRLGINIAGLKTYRMLLLFISIAFFIFGADVLTKTFLGIPLIPI